MPVVGIPVKMLLERIATPLDREDLVEHLQHLGCDVEGYATVRRFRCRRCDNVVEITETENPPVVCDRCAVDYRERPEAQVALGSSDVIRMELLAVRPDMFDPGGLARVLRSYLGETAEPARYPLAPPRTSVQVDPRLEEQSSLRPWIACAIVRGFTLSEERIKVVMKLQENLHWAMGRDRKHASIGVYDLDTVKVQQFQYRSVGPDELRFVPLGYDPHSAASQLTPQQVLEQHAKGRAYARLLAGFTRYPLLTDEAGTVMSMPPIINSEPTRLRPESRNFFIDVTGTEERIVNRCLNVLCTSLLELDREAKLEQVTIRYASRERVTPDLTPQSVALDPQATARRIGVELSREDVARHLQQMGHGVREATSQELLVEVPAYRNDIMHPVDLMEDVAIAYGYHHIQPALVPTMTVGLERPIERQAEVARRTLTGLGYQEAMTLILGSPETNYDALRLPRGEDCVLIENPISLEQTMIRVSLLPGLLETLAINTSHELPQHLFEVGNITLLDAEAETGACEHRRVAGAAIGPRVDYSEIRSTCQALLREFGWQIAAEPDSAPCFIPGRGARVLAVRGEERRCIGRMGELHPEVLEGHKLVHPVSVFELDLEALMR